MPFDGHEALGLKKIFGSILKVEDQEDGTIKVYGVASSESRDGAGEIVRASAMEDALPDYSRFPALREMHQPMAAGKVLEAEVDANGVTQIVAHVVDPVAIVKVRTGVYAGFSIGGKVTKRDPNDRTIITGLRLVEISLVDSPCNPDAILTMWKADLMKIENPTNKEVIARAKELAKAAGTQRYRDFLFQAREDIVAERTLEAVEKGEMDLEPPASDTTVIESSAAGDETTAALEPEKEAVAEPGKEPAAEEPAATVEEPATDPAKEAAAEPGQDPEEEDHAGEGDREPAAGEEGKEAGAEAEAVTVEDPAAALNAAIEKGNDAIEAATPPAPADPFADLEKVGAALKGISVGEEAAPLAKGMYEVSRFADLLCSFACVQRCLASEAEYEGDSSPIPAELATAINNLGEILVRLAQEEVAELVASLRVPEGEPEIEIIYAGDEVMLAQEIIDLVKADAELMEKALERQPKATEPSASPGEGDEDEATKEAAAAAARIGELETENEGLKKALEEAAPKVEKLVEGFQAQIDELRKRFEDEPLPPKTAGAAATRAIEKGNDSAGAPIATPEQPGDGVPMTDEQLDKYWAELSEAERGHILMKAALQRPRLLATRNIGPAASAS